jgi:hypothetical protein
MAIRSVPDDPDGYAQWYSQLDADIQKLVPSRFSPANVKLVRGMGGSPEQNAKADLTRAQVADKEFQQGAAAVGRAQTAAEAQQLIDQMPHGQARRLPPVPKEDDFDPEEWGKAVDESLLTPAQRTTARAGATREADAEVNRQFNRDLKTGKLGASPAMTPGQAATQGRHLDREKDRHDQMQAQERGWWGLHSRFAGLLDASKLPDGATFLYPTPTVDKAGNMKISVKEQTMSPEWREQVKEDYGKAETTAKQLQQQQKDLRQRYGWGEFKQAGPTAPQLKVGSPVRHNGKPAHIVGFDSNNKPLIVYDK